MKIFSRIGDKIWQFDQIENNSKQFMYEKEDRLNYDFKSLGNNRFVLIIDGQSHLVQIIKRK